MNHGGKREGSGRKANPKRKPTQSFRPDLDVSEYLSSLNEKGLKTKVINQAIREYFQQNHV